MCSITPELFARLLPVHHMIFDYLSQSSPHLIAQLNKSYHRKTLPSLYRVVPVNRKSIAMFDMNSTRLDSPLPCPAHHTEVLRVVNLESALLFVNYRLEYNGQDPSPRDSPIIPLVKQVEFSFAVFQEDFFSRFYIRMVNLSCRERTLQNELRPQSQLKEFLVHIDCSSEKAKITDFYLTVEGISRYRTADFNHADTLTLVLHVPENGQMVFRRADIDRQTFYKLRFMLPPRLETKEEGSTGCTTGVSAPSPEVLNAFAALIGDFAFHILVDDVGSDLEEVEEWQLMGLALDTYTFEVCCRSAGEVKQLAKRHLRSRHPRLADPNLDWPVRFLELDKETVDEYDLWSMRP
ncbi:hypothetical protein I350_00075 [Cryptococcus amylolentus CBS 6273]|uniref:Uncharacterized protein n=1 Tax=Cryptococcus amylolentus CBS 6273 TaxID=1296118 RepID=A0A1E3KDY6_9TREE|nr:hypothetical protein I350_00075 [Cryptococcus amylolentus CBS 6273]